jgi:hypothetical protein
VRVGDAEIPWINEHLFDSKVDELRLPSSSLPLTWIH